jgi:hypothetical protein
MTVRILIVCGGSGVNLLGQRSELGLHAEIQIDVSEEIRVERQSREDPFSTGFVKLDQGIGTTGILFRDISLQIQQQPQQQQLNNPYLNAFSSQEALRHFDFLQKTQIANIALKYGLGRSPAIGGLTIRHTSNQASLAEVLGRLLSRHGIGPNNDVEAWIVSSTAGGTGEGIHRFVGAFLANYVQQNFAANTQVTLNFIRVGPMTYQTVDHRRTSLNTFFGIAADVAFILWSKAIPNLTTNWFYLDLPDVGIGQNSKPWRAQLVELAAKTIMLKELQSDLNATKILYQEFPMMATRVGFWGRDFARKQKYYQTLRQLRQKLEDLINPDYEKKISQARVEPTFEIGEELNTLIGNAQDRANVQRQIEGGWKFPRPNIRDPKSLESLRQYVDACKKEMSSFVAGGWENVLASSDWWVERMERTGTEEPRPRRVVLRVPEMEQIRFGTPEWFRNIAEAQEAYAWARYLLGCDLKKKEGQLVQGRGLAAELLRCAREISSAFYRFGLFRTTEDRAREVAARLGKFVELLAKVDRLLQLEKKAQSLLASQLSEAHRILERVKADTGESGGSTQVIQAAELDHPLDQAMGRTWLELLQDAIRRHDPNAFERAVLRGATGLTIDGLREVLGLPPQADIEAIHTALASQMGRIPDPSDPTQQRFSEAPWWQAIPPPEGIGFQYRILPLKDKKIKEELDNYANPQQVNFRYIYTDQDIGLYILAFHCVPLAQVSEGDPAKATSYLLQPLVQHFRGALRTPELIASSGVIGEPLYLPGLKQALAAENISDQELNQAINTIAQFYLFYP